MKKLLISFAMMLGLAGSALASGATFPVDKAPNRATDLKALQNGAKYFVNYCLSCHSANFVRFNRMQDIGLTDKQIQENLLFTTDKVGDTMKAAINPQQAKEWFGANPPDLSLIARSRSGSGYSGADYVYTLLRHYYRDSTKPTGWNNNLFPNIGMPNPLWELQGQREAVMEKMESHGHQVEVFKGYKTIQAGAMTQVEFDNVVGDLVAYLQWMGEPARNSRVRTGAWVLVFLLVFSLVTWRLNAAFWRDVK